MPHARLVLHPENATDRPEDMSTLLGSLRDIGLIADPWRDGAFLAGPEFVSLVTFLGCAPDVQLHPDEGDRFCHIVVRPITETPLSLGHTGTVVPRCSACKHRISTWRSIPDWQQADTRYRCDQCGSEQRMAELKWRQEAGYGRFALDIVHIHPHEAVPSEKLLTTLRKATDFDWTYCYATDR